jgi:hypothetical protein
MNMNNRTAAEPVPLASELVVLPFVAAVAGYLAHVAGADARLRVTMHRTVWRDGEGRMQQLCDYLGTPGAKGLGRGVGRVLPMDTGIAGEALRTGKLVRTKEFKDEQALQDVLRRDMATTGDSALAVATAYLAVPFLYETSAVVVLYAEAYRLNLFALDDVVNAVVGMCRSFCSVLDGLEQKEVPMFRNYPPTRTGLRTTGGLLVYPNLQEVLAIPPPTFTHVRDINYDVMFR